ncbi:MAG: DUF3857 domain-containing protein [Phycisphaerae bacterium]|nr:DUF3857 domain-containing protein [Phycisphaerae bacterium]
MKTKLLMLLILLAFSLTAFAGDIDTDMFDKYKWDHDTVLAEAARVTSSVYPNADMLMICDHSIDYYNTDASYVTWMDMYEKVLTEKGKHENQSVTLPFNETYSQWIVKVLEIIKPDGTVVPVDIKAQSKVMVDRSQMSANIYDPAQKILQIGLPGLEIGDIIHSVIVRDNYKPRAKGIWCGFQTFESPSPIRNFVYEIYEPKELPLQRIEIKDAIEGTVKYTTRQENGRKVYRWDVTNVPQLFVEPAMPEYYNVAQRLLVSTAPDWKAVSKWYWQLSEPYYGPTDEMKAKVAELTANCTTDQQKIEAVFKFVSQDIRYLGIIPEGEDEAPGYQPHHVKQTFDNRHGVCRDKAALLVVMLRLAGLDAYPVLINNGPKKDMEVPQPYFNHAITAVQKADGSYILMDSTDENTKDLFPGYLCDKSYLVAKPDGETLLTSPIIPAMENLMVIKTTGKIKANGDLEARCELRFNGINDNIYRGYFATIAAQQRRQFFESVIKRVVPGATLTDCQIRPADMLNTAEPMEVDIEFTASDVLIGQGDTIMLPTISMDRSVGMANFILRNTGLEKRRFPMKTDSACGVQQQLEIQIDPTIGQSLSMPAYANIDDDIITLKRNLKFSDNKLIGDSTFLINVTEMKPDQYLKLKKHLKTMEYNDRKMAIFARKASESNADVITESIIREYKLADAHNWTETVTVKKQIKTYKGKKDASELKFDFNQGWENVKILSAKVITDGNVKEITKDEMNLMDQAWVASAPRYPAGKTLVASLPGVELGSTIEYKYQRVITGQPFFTMTEIFAGQDPVWHKAVVVEMPQDIAHKVLIDQNGIMTPDVDGQEAVKKIIVQSDGTINYTFIADNFQIIPREDSMAPADCFVPTVKISAGNWQQYAKKIKNKLDKATSKQAKAQSKAKELTKGKRGTDSVVAIRDFLARNIRKVGPGLGAMTETSISKADKTLADGYGNSTDHAILLHTMLKAAGFKPEFVLACGASGVDEIRKAQLDYSNASLFGTVLVRVKVEGKDIYLNDTNQYDQLGVTGYDDYPVMDMDGHIAELDIDDNLEDGSYQQYDIKVQPDGDADFKLAIKIQGQAFGSSKRTYDEMPPEKLNRHIQQMVASIAQSAELAQPFKTDFQQYPGTLSFAVTVDKYAVCDGDKIYFDFPVSLSVLGLRTDEHQSPYYFTDRSPSTAVVNIDLPDGYDTILMAPETKTWTLPNGAGTIEIKVTHRDNGDLTIVQKTDIDFAVVKPENYDELLEINRQISHKSMEMILVKKAN